MPNKPPRIEVAEFIEENNRDALVTAYRLWRHEAHGRRRRAMYVNWGRVLHGIGTTVATVYRELIVAASDADGITLLGWGKAGDDALFRVQYITVKEAMGAFPHENTLEGRWFGIVSQLAHDSAVVAWEIHGRPQ